jgi:hypothetical protein
MILLVIQFVFSLLIMTWGIYQGRATVVGAGLFLFLIVATGYRFDVIEARVRNLERVKKDQ